MSLVILSGMVVSRSEATLESKDLASASFFAEDDGRFSGGFERAGQFLGTTLLTLYSKGSFDCARVRFANSLSAQDDNALGRV